MKFQFVWSLDIEAENEEQAYNKLEQYLSDNEVNESVAKSLIHNFTIADL